MEGMLIAQRWPIPLVLGPTAGILLADLAKRSFSHLQVQHSAWEARMSFGLEETRPLFAIGPGRPSPGQDTFRVSQNITWR